MKRIWLATTLVLCGLAQSLIGWSSAFAEDDGATGAKLLPKDTLLYFSILDIPEARKEFEKSPILNDPEFQPFLSDVKAKIEELSEQVREEIGLSITELLAIPEGELTLAVMERPKRRIAPVLLMDYGDNKEPVEKLLKKLHDTLDGDIAEHSKEEIDDVVVHVYTMKEADSPIKKIVYVNEDSYLVISTEIEALKEILTRWEGKDDNTLADNDVYKYILDKCKDEAGEPAVVWYVSPIGMIQSGIGAAQAAVPQASMQVGMAAAFLPTLGLDKLKGWGGAGYSASGDFETVSKSFVYAEQTKGVLNVFQFPAADLAPPKWVSAKTSMYYGGNWNIGGAYLAIESMVDGFYGRGFTAKQLDKLANDESGPGLHPKKDLIDLLDGKFHLVQAIEETEDEPIAQRFLLAFDTKDVAKLKKTLAKATKEGGPGVESREFNGETIYEVSAGPDQTISMAVAAGHFVVTNDTAALEAMLRTESQPALVDSPAYRKISKHFPAKMSMLSYSEGEAQVKPLYDMLKSADNVDFLEGIDFQKLPPFEAMRKYLRSSGSYTVPDAKGALSVGFQLKEADK